MPTLTTTNPNYSASNSTKAPPSRKGAIPPDVLVALELLFSAHAYSGGSDSSVAVIPTPGWFIAEAFAAQQYKTFRPTEDLQHYLQSLLGSRCYAGAFSLRTYFIPLAQALLLHALTELDLDSDSMEKIKGSARACLMHWGYRQEKRDAVLGVLMTWVHRTLEKLEAPACVGNLERVLEVAAFLRKRGGALGKGLEKIAIESRID